MLALIEERAAISTRYGGICGGAMTLDAARLSEQSFELAQLAPLSSMATP